MRDMAVRRRLELWKEKSGPTEVTTHAPIEVAALTEDSKIEFSEDGHARAEHLTYVLFLRRKGIRVPRDGF